MCDNEHQNDRELSIIEKNILDSLIWLLYKNKECDKHTANYIADLLYNENFNNFNKIDILKRVKKIKKYRTKLAELKEYPLIKQRSSEWFELRKNRLTASDLYDAIGKSNTILAKKKAGVLIDNTNFNNIAPLKWGTMFEPMAIRCYSQKNNDIIVNEFGLIPDKKLEHFGASPDGITELGIMIEIKCPYTRKLIDNYIPPKYYSQIQGQLAVCELEECDYIECNFKTFETEEEYIGENKESIIDHGIIGEFKNKESSEYSYLYSDEYLNTINGINNINSKILLKNQEDNSVYFNKLIYWKLEKINVQKVLYDDKEWCNIIPKINSFWEKVENSKSLPVEYKKEKKIEKFAFIPEDD